MTGWSSRLAGAPGLSIVIALTGTLPSRDARYVDSRSPGQGSAGFAGCPRAKYNILNLLCLRPARQGSLNFPRRSASSWPYFRF